MDSLPSPSYGVTWRDYEIATPTFDLTPIEKPDMSPYLVHMTGKGQLTDILAGNNYSSPLPPESGFLRATPPEQSHGVYDAPVVCFSESPTFALDFFRYRSFPRWKADQRFGIGFRKTSMVDLGTRPVIYADDATTRQIVSLHKSLSALPPTTPRETQMQALLSNVFPILFPMLETDRRQGFMWEREWRYPEASGLVFPYDDICIICCPAEEEPDLRKIIGATAEKIQFVRTWREYSDVTDFLRRQQPVWDAREDAVKRARNLAQRIEAKGAHVQQLQIALHSLDSYEALVEKFNAEQERIIKERESIAAQLQQAEGDLEELKSAKVKAEANGESQDLGLKE